MIYFDLCALQRPHDDPCQFRVRMEATAVLAILLHCRKHGIGFASSDVLTYELRKNPHPVRRAHSEAILGQAVVHQPMTDEMEHRAEELTAQALAALDALHLAAAETVGATVFCTCDDRILRKGRSLVRPPLRVLSPIELASELGL